MEGGAALLEQEKVLITGGAGFLGINLARYLMARGYALASLDLEEFDYPERGLFVLALYLFWLLLRVGAGA